jgi:hypothetical protein
LTCEVEVSVMVLAVVGGRMSLQCYFESDTKVLTSATDSPKEILVDFLG